jgi:hypothetical protein
VTEAKSYRWTRRVGFVLGLALSVALLVAWQVPAGSGRLGLDARVMANQTGELQVTPVGAFVTGTGLEARTRNDSARGRTKVTNQTGRTLEVRMRLLPNTRDLDRLLLVDARAAGRSLFSGQLGAARRWSSRTVRVGPGKSSEIELLLRLPRDAGESYRGRIADISLELRSTVVGGRNER